MKSRSFIELGIIGSLLAALAAPMISCGGSAAGSSNNNTNNNNNNNNNPPAGSHAYFLGTNGAANGLFMTDGTSAGTVLVKDVGSASSVEMMSVGSNVYFSTLTGRNGALWRSDGTAAGTIQLGPTFSGAPGGFATTQSTLLFFANDGVHGWELWKTDGTTNGTAMVLDINAGNADSVHPTEDLLRFADDPPKTLGSFVFFGANDGHHGFQVWKSDGTAAGTSQVADIVGNGVNGSSFPDEFAVVGSQVFFEACDTAHGCELWKTDGTSAGTVLVKDINPGTADSSPTSLFTDGSTAYFSACDNVNGCELYKSDGTTAGTVLVKDIYPGIPGGSAPRDFVLVGTTLFFHANDAAHGLELYTTDGTAGGTVLVKDINPGGGSSTNVGSGTARDPEASVSIGTALLFGACDTNPLADCQLWKSDGTAAGTVALTTALNGIPRCLIPFKGGALFVGHDATHGYELWKSDGTAAGTTLVVDLNPGTAEGFPVDCQFVIGP
jgi:ELWxxDGT repeat protein